MRRRHFLKLGSALVGSGLLPSAAAVAASRRHAITSVTAVESAAAQCRHHWLGPAFWGNRLQDWQWNHNRLECLRGDKDFEVRTVSLITRALNQQHQAGRVRARVGQMEVGKPGFCGFLLGVGAGALDYRGSALAQRAGGTAGGLLATLDHRGHLSFRDFSNPEKPVAFETFSRSQTASNTNPIGKHEWVLDCHIDPVSGGRFDIRLVASDAVTGEETGFAVVTGIAAEHLTGGISLVSSPPPGQSGGRWWFADIATGGAKVDEDTQRGLGPVMGCMHSVNGDVCKLSAQLMPVASDYASEAWLQHRVRGSKAWQAGGRANIEQGYIAAFRIENWQAQHDHDYRIILPGHGEVFRGSVQKDPGTTRELRIALYSCMTPTAKSLDDLHYRAAIPEEVMPGRYTRDNILFPHQEMVGHCDSLQPDLYVFCGDQYYETFPTRYGRDTPDAELDTLYRWYLWYWTFRESLRHRPAIVLADDHDILQGNLWGNGGDGSRGPREEDGGYKWDKGLVRMIHRIQNAHTPDPYDPTPIQHDIPVAYAHFRYGGVSFAMVEDRKFKSPPDYAANPLETRGELLGQRQEDFLAHWAKIDRGMPKICLTASIWGSPQTDEQLAPLLDYDANGYPPDGRDRAVQLVTDAGALVLAGDQHLGMVARQTLDDFEQGALFFAGPAAASFWQRWFEGGGKLENPVGDDPNTGNFIDSFGNRMRVLAVANPAISHAEFSDDNTTWGKFVTDRRLKSEGYGLVRVNHALGQYQLECWPWDANPQQDAQFRGWPQTHPFPLPSPD